MEQVVEVITSMTLQLSYHKFHRKKNSMQAHISQSYILFLKIIILLWKARYNIMASV